MLDELESKQRYNDYLREVRQEQLYRQVKANQSALPQKILRCLSNLFITVRQYLKGKNYFQTDFPSAIGGKNETHIT